jgi:hypothetical protein
VKRVWILVALGILAASLALPTAAAERTVLKNISSVSVRVCPHVTQCDGRGALLPAGKETRWSALGWKARAVYVQPGYRAVITGGGSWIDRPGPATVELPACACTRTVQMVKKVPAATPTGTAVATAHGARVTKASKITKTSDLAGRTARRTQALAQAAKSVRTGKSAPTKGSQPKASTTRTGAGGAAEITPGRARLGTSRSGLPWLSGVWSGGRFSPAEIRAYGSWRGRPIDVVTAYSNRASYERTAKDTWSIDVWKGIPGRLNYGLGILPDSGEGSLDSIARGDQDKVWRAVAKNLLAAGRGNSIVRIGWEANLSDWRWGVKASNAASFRAAFRRVAKTLKATAPDLVIDFGIGCGPGLPGSSDRTASLSKLYPGDDVVDIIDCDIYDWWTTRVRSSKPDPVLKPPHGVGLADVAKFARSHRKLMGIGEWGLARQSNGNGGGDNPMFIKAMADFMKNNADVLAYECYFDEPAGYLKSSLNTGQNPQAATTYKRLW